MLDGGSWRDVGRGALRGGIAGGVTRLTLGFGGAALAGTFGGGMAGGAFAGAVASGAGDLAAQAFDNFTGYRCGIDLVEVGTSALVSGAFGGAFVRPYTAPIQPVTSWAPRGVTPNLNPNRWVMVGVHRSVTIFELWDLLFDVIPLEILLVVPCLEPIWFIPEGRRETLQGNSVKE